MCNRPIRVLLVDDEPDFLDMLALRLEVEGMDVHCVYSGMECLKYLAEDDFDVVFLDMLMPGMGGVETLDEIRKNAYQVEVVIMTGHGPAEGLRKCAGLGVYDTLFKPADFKDVLRVIHGAYQHLHGR